MRIDETDLKRILQQPGYGIIADGDLVVIADANVTASDPGALAAIPQRRKPAKLAVPTEAEEQAAFVTWAKMHEERYPALRWLFAVTYGSYAPNHTALSTGTNAGVPDLWLPWASVGPNGEYRHGLVIELKRSDRSNHTTPEQDEWIAHLRRQGWLVAVCYGAEEAIRVTTHYLESDQ